MFDPVAIEIDEETKEAIREALEDMDKPVEINVYIGPNCKYCSETLKIAKTLEEVAPVRNGTRLIKVNVYEKDKDKSAFEEQGITRIPSLTFLLSP